MLERQFSRQECSSHPSSCKPIRRAHQPGALRLRPSPFRARRTFILPEANSGLLLARNAVSAAKRSSALLLPKHAWALHLSFPALRSSTICPSCDPKLSGKLLGYVSRRELCQDNKLASTLLLTLVATGIRTTFQEQSSCLLQGAKAPPLWRCCLPGLSRLEAPRGTQDSLARTEIPDRRLCAFCNAARTSPVL